MSRFVKNTVTLLKKDFKDSLRNAGMSIMLVLPPVFAAVFRFMSIVDLGGSYILMLTTVMSATMIPLSFLATIIAEEKEKNTLRTLMLAGVSAGEFITSKVIVCWFFMQCVNVLDFLIIGASPAKLPMFLLLSTLGSVSLLMIGAVIGILSRDQMSTSILSVPVMMLLLLPSTLGLISPVFGAIAEFSPVEHMLRMFQIWDSGGSLFSPDGLRGMLVMAAWTAAGVLLYIIAYRRKRLDA